MKNAWESRETYSGKNLTSRERVVGGIVVWGVVAIVALVLGRALVSIPPTFWDFLKR